MSEKYVTAAGNIHTFHKKEKSLNLCCTLAQLYVYSATPIGVPLTFLSLPQGPAGPPGLSSSPPFSIPRRYDFGEDYQFRGKEGGEGGRGDDGEDDDARA